MWLWSAHLKWMFNSRSKDAGLSDKNISGLDKTKFQEQIVIVLKDRSHRPNCPIPRFRTFVLCDVNTVTVQNVQWGPSAHGFLLLVRFKCIFLPVSEGLSLLSLDSVPELKWQSAKYVYSLIWQRSWVFKKILIVILKNKCYLSYPLEHLKWHFVHVFSQYS